MFGTTVRASTDASRSGRRSSEWSSLELAACYDQLDMPNLASVELLGRLYQMVEESRGTLSTEGLDHFIGRDATAGVRRGVALAPELANDAVTRRARETEIVKRRRRAREEK